MKKVLMLMLGLVAGTASFAHSSDTQPSASKPRVVMTADQKIRLYIQPDQTRGELAIRDGNGHTLYSSTVSLQKGFQQQFDVSGLATGIYRLTLTTDHQATTRTFVVQDAPDANFLVQEP